MSSLLDAALSLKQCSGKHAMGMLTSYNSFKAQKKHATWQGSVAKQQLHPASQAPKAGSGSRYKLPGLSVSHPLSGSGHAARAAQTSALHPCCCSWPHQSPGGTQLLRVMLKPTPCSAVLHLAAVRLALRQLGPQHKKLHQSACSLLRLQRSL